MRRSLAFFSLFGVLGCLAGCGGGGTHATTTTTTSTKATGTTPVGQLEQAARVALEQNTRATDYVLVHNAVPKWASESTAGPALSALRTSAAQRRAGKVTVRLLSSKVQIRSVTLDPSYATARASVVEESRVRVYDKGHLVGGVRRLNEPAQVELHRVGEKPAFVVWKVAGER